MDLWSYMEGAQISMAVRSTAEACRNAPLKLDVGMAMGHTPDQLANQPSSGLDLSADAARLCFALADLWQCVP